MSIYMCVCMYYQIYIYIHFCLFYLCVYVHAYVIIFAYTCIGKGLEGYRLNR